MSLPRRILPNSTYLVTRRCAQRQYLLKPSPVINEVIRFVLAEAVRRYDVLLHAVMVMSNHLHLVLTDQHGNLPAVMAFVNKHVAKVLNAHYGRFENLWASGTYSAVRLVTPSAVLDKLLYTMTNAVRSDLVAKVEDWPGVCTQPGDFGAVPAVACRPKLFFRPHGPVPEQARFAVSKPPCFSHLTDTEWQALLERRVAEIVARCRVERDAADRSVLGARRVLSTDPFASPSARASRFRLRPHVAARDRAERIAALLELKAFREAYYIARQLWLAGVPDVEFPPGTYWLRHHANVTCAAA